MRLSDEPQLLLERDLVDLASLFGEHDILERCGLLCLGGLVFGVAVCVARCGPGDRSRDQAVGQLGQGERRLEER